LRTERLLVGAAFITCLGNSIQLTASALLLLRTERTALAVGWLFIAVALPQVLLSIGGGRLADRFDRRALAVVCDAAAALTALGLPLWLVLGGPVGGAAYLANFALAMISAVFMPVTNALIKERVRDERLGRFNASFEVATQAGTLLSAAAGGFLIAGFGIEPLLFFNALTFVASAACTYALGRLPEPVAVTDDEAVRTAPKARAQAPLARLGLLYAIGNIVITLSNTLLVVLVIDAFQRGPGMLGVVDALAGVGILFAAAVYQRASARMDNLKIALGGYLACATLIALEPFGLAALLLVIPFASLSFGLARVAARTMLMRAVPAHRAGRVFGATNAFGLAFSVVATIAISGVADATSVTRGFHAFAGLVAVTTAVAALALWHAGRRAVRPKPLHPEPAEAGA